MSLAGKKVVLFGTGDFARVASVYLEQDSPHEVAAFTVHEQHRTAAELLGKPVVPFEAVTERYPPGEHAMFVAIGYKRVNRARAEICEQARALGYELISYVNSRAVHWGELDLGDNCFIFENNVIQPFVRLGSNVVLWSGNHVGHDSTIGDHCFITSHAVISGNVTVSPYCFIGVNATIRDGVTLGAGSVIGAGAIILKDTEPESVHGGTHTPAASIKSSQLRSFK